MAYSPAAFTKQFGLRTKNCCNNKKNEVFLTNSVALGNQNDGGKWRWAQKIWSAASLGPNLSRQSHMKISLPSGRRKFTSYVGRYLRGLGLQSRCKKPQDYLNICAVLPSPHQKLVYMSCVNSSCSISYQNKPKSHHIFASLGRNYFE